MTDIFMIVGFGLLGLFLVWSLLLSIVEGDFGGILLFGGILFICVALWLPKVYSLLGVTL